MLGANVKPSGQKFPSQGRGSEPEQKQIEKTYPYSPSPKSQALEIQGFPANPPPIKILDRSVQPLGYDWCH